MPKASIFSTKHQKKYCAHAMTLEILMPNHGSVVFTLDNTFEGKAPQKENGQFLSPKHKGYGIGLNSASGVLKTDAKNGIFCVSVVLNP